MRLYKSLIAGLKSGYDKSHWKVGEWRSVDKPTECVGLNCSKTPLDAMRFVDCEILAEVEVDGVIVKSEDKWTCEKMRITKAWYWEKVDSVEMAIFCAELVIDQFEKKYPDDKRPREAIDTAKAWVKNPCKTTRDAASAAAASASAAASAAAYAASASAYAGILKKINKWIINRIKTLNEYRDGE